MKKITLKYPALFEINSYGISISFPDIPGCLSCAFTKRKARKMAKEALQLMISGTEVDKLPTQTYPIKRFSSKKFYVRMITVQMEINGKYLIDRDIVYAD